MSLNARQRSAGVSYQNSGHRSKGTLSAKHPLIKNEAQKYSVYLIPYFYQYSEDDTVLGQVTIGSKTDDIYATELAPFAPIYVRKHKLTSPTNAKFVRDLMCLRGMDEDTKTHWGFAADDYCPACELAVKGFAVRKAYRDLKCMDKFGVTYDSENEAHRKECQGLFDLNINKTERFASGTKDEDKTMENNKELRVIFPVVRLAQADKVVSEKDMKTILNGIADGSYTDYTVGFYSCSNAQFMDLTAQASAKSPYEDEGICGAPNGMTGGIFVIDWTKVTNPAQAAADGKVLFATYAQSLVDSATCDKIFSLTDAEVEEDKFSRQTAFYYLTELDRYEMPKDKYLPLLNEYNNVLNAEIVELSDQPAVEKYLSNISDLGKKMLDPLYLTVKFQDDEAEIMPLLEVGAPSATTPALEDKSSDGEGDAESEEEVVTNQFDDDEEVAEPEPVPAPAPAAPAAPKPAAAPPAPALDDSDLEDLEEM